MTPINASPSPHRFLWILAKILIGIMLVGTLGGIVKNVEFLQRYGFEGASSRYALTGLVFELLLFVVWVRLLRMRFAKN